MLSTRFCGKLLKVTQNSSLALKIRNSNINLKLANQHCNITQRASSLEFSSSSSLQHQQQSINNYKYFIRFYSTDTIFPTETVTSKTTKNDIPTLNEKELYKLVNESMNGLTNTSGQEQIQKVNHLITTLKKNNNNYVWYDEFLTTLITTKVYLCENIHDNSIVKEFEGYLKTDTPDNIVILVWMVRYYGIVQDYVNLSKYFWRLYKVQPKIASTYYLELARVIITPEQREELREFIEKRIQEDPTNPRLYVSLASISLHYKKAIEYYSKVIEIYKGMLTENNRAFLTITFGLEPWKLNSILLYATMMKFTNQIYINAYDDARITLRYSLENTKDALIFLLPAIEPIKKKQNQSQEEIEFIQNVESDIKSIVSENELKKINFDIPLAPEVVQSMSELEKGMDKTEKEKDLLGFTEYVRLSLNSIISQSKEPFAFDFSTIDYVGVIHTAQDHIIFSKAFERFFSIINTSGFTESQKKFQKVILRYLRVLISSIESYKGLPQFLDDFVNQSSSRITPIMHNLDESFNEKSAKILKLYNSEKFQEALDLILDIEKNMLHRDDHLASVSMKSCCYHGLNNKQLSANYSREYFKILRKTYKVISSATHAFMTQMSLSFMYHLHVLGLYQESVEHYEWFTSQLENGWDSATTPTSPTMLSVMEYYGIATYFHDRNKSKKHWMYLLGRKDVDTRVRVSGGIYLGDIMRMERQYETALNLYQTSESLLLSSGIPRNSDLKDIALGKAAIYCDQKDKEKWKEQLFMAIKYDDKCAEAYCRLSEIENIYGSSPEDALKYAKKAIKLFEETDNKKSQYLLDSFHNYGVALNALAKYYESYKVFSSTIQLLYDGFPKEEAFQRPNLFNMAFISGVNYCITSLTEDLQSYCFKTDFEFNLQELDEVTYDSQELSHKLHTLIKIVKGFQDDEFIPETTKSKNQEFIKILLDSFQNGLLTLKILESFPKEISLDNIQNDIVPIIQSSVDLIVNVLNIDEKPEN